MENQTSTKSTINIDDKDILNALWKYLNSEAFKSISDTDDDHSEAKVIDVPSDAQTTKENDKWDNNLQLCANYHLTKDIVLPISCTLFSIAQERKTTVFCYKCFEMYKTP